MRGRGGLRERPRLPDDRDEDRRAEHRRTHRQQGQPLRRAVVGAASPGAVGASPPLADQQSEPVVLAVLQPAQLRRRRELAMVAVADRGIRQRGLQAQRVGPGVLAPTHAAPLANIEQQPDIGAGERSEEALKRCAVDADRRNRELRHTSVLPDRRGGETVRGPAGSHAQPAKTAGARQPCRTPALSARVLAGAGSSTSRISLGQQGNARERVARCSEEPMPRQLPGRYLFDINKWNAAVCGYGASRSIAQPPWPSRR